MGDQFQIIEKKIEKGILYLQAQGILMKPVSNGKLRILAVFSGEKQKRRFPIEADCFTVKGISFFSIRQDISLPDIFYRYTEKEAAGNVSVTFEYCDAEGTWHLLSESFVLEGQLFLPFQQKTSLGYRIYRKAAYVICSLLLPVWLLDGYFVVKGMKKSPYLEGDARGKRGIFYHAHGIVKQITGYGYSMREIKTGYFVRKYRKACKKVTGTSGILFLSERTPDVGGNLDLIRKGMQEKGEPYQEFIDSRPIHKLPFSRIKRAAKLAAGAKVIVLEDFYPQLHALELREDTKVVQLWHACGAFKMFGLSDIGKVSHLGQDTRNHRSYSAAFVSGEKMVPFYSEAFGIAPEQVLPLGVPRTDIFFEEEYGRQVQKRLYEKYPVLSGKRVVLFAPTFRGGGNKDAYYLVERFLVDDLLKAVPEDTVLVIKNHPFVRQHFSYKEENQSRVLDLTGKENINDILFITSLLITDYSSCIFEAALLSIPMLFYVFDLEEYVKGRDIYFDFASFAPGKQVQSFEALKEETKKQLAAENFQTEDVSGKENTEEFSVNAASRRQEEFCEYFLGSLDGHSTERVLDFITELVHKEDS